MSHETKYKLYKRLIKNEQDKHGFIESHECDSLLFSGLVGCVPEVYIDIKAAQMPDGSWQRRPTDLPPCCTLESWSFIERCKLALKARTTDTKVLQKIFEKGGSTISRDMLMGLAWYAYFNKRLDISEAVIKYALSHKLIMGTGTPTRTLLTPGLLSTYAWISYRLGGPSRLLLRYIPQTESKGLTDFQAHLSVLHILLRNKLTGKDKYSNVLAHHAERQPDNALFQFAAGNVDKAKALLDNEQWWPKDRLPTAEDRSTQWLFQRDYGSDWLPENSDKQHSGADYLFCYWLINSYHEES